MSVSERIIWFCIAVAIACGAALTCSPSLRIMVEKEMIAFFNAVIMLAIVFGSIVVFGWIVIQLCRVVWNLFQRGDGWFAKIDQHLNLIENAFTPVENRISSISFEVSQLREKLEEIENKISPTAEAPKAEESAETVLENVMDEFTEVDYE